MDVTAYRLYLLKRGLRETTINVRLRLIWYLKGKIKPFTETNCNDFLCALKTKGSTNGYINSVVATIRIICDCEQLEWGKNVKYWVSRRTEKLTLSETEIRQFISVDYYRQRDSFTKWRMFWLLVASCGFRCGEVANLKATEVNLAEKSR